MQEFYKVYFCKVAPEKKTKMENSAKSRLLLTIQSMHFFSDPMCTVLNVIYSMTV